MKDDHVLGQELEEAANGEGPGLEGPLQIMGLVHQVGMFFRVFRESGEPQPRKDLLFIVEVLNDG